MLPKLHEFLSTLPQNGSLILLIIPPNYPNTRRITCVRFGISAAKAIRSSQGLFLWAMESRIRGNAQGRDTAHSRWMLSWASLKHIPWRSVHHWPAGRLHTKGLWLTGLPAYRGLLAIGETSTNRSCWGKGWFEEAASRHATVGIVLMEDARGLLQGAQ